MKAELVSMVSSFFVMMEGIIWSALRTRKTKMTNSKRKNQKRAMAEMTCVDLMWKKKTEIYHQNDKGTKWMGSPPLHPTTGKYYEWAEAERHWRNEGLIMIATPSLIGLPHENSGF